LFVLFDVFWVLESRQKVGKSKRGLAARARAKLTKVRHRILSCCSLLNNNRNNSRRHPQQQHHQRQQQQQQQPPQQQQQQQQD
jgi:hypothetical protein